MQKVVHKDPENPKAKTLLVRARLTLSSSVKEGIIARARKIACQEELPFQQTPT
jgi:hypothetical protein